jgi:hypothetical protein
MLRNIIIYKSKKFCVFLMDLIEKVSEFLKSGKREVIVKGGSETERFYAYGELMRETLGKYFVYDGSVVNCERLDDASVVDLG